jgi:hypothetical protein
MFKKGQSSVQGADSQEALVSPADRKTEQREKSKGVPCPFGGGDRTKQKLSKVGTTRLAGSSDGHWSPRAAKAKVLENISSPESKST